MNIFVLDTCPIQAAKYHCDKHVGKMLIEACQMMCVYMPDAPYRATHRNHPCTKWVGASVGNFMWLFQLARALADEFLLRRGKRHKTTDVVDWIQMNFDKVLIPNELVSITPFVIAAPDKYKAIKDVVEAYRQYYIGEKSTFAEWKWCKDRPEPDWWP